MKFKKWIFLFLLVLAYSNSNAQTTPVVPMLPVSGVFVLQDEEGSRVKDFNKVSIESSTFSLLMNDQVVRTYRILSEMKGGYWVEQVVTGDQYKENFTVTISQVSDEECFFTVHYEEGSETIHLRKLE